MEFLYWIFYYAIPAGIATYLLKRQQSSVKNRVLTMHGFVLLSIFLLSIIHVSLNWNFQAYQLLILGAGTLLSVYLMGFRGLLYAVSSAIQEYCLLLASVLIIPTTGLWLGAIITSLPYTFAHFGRRLEKPNWYWKFPLLSLYGTFSILLYFWFQQPLLNIALHTVAGAILIRIGILYQPDKNNKTSVEEINF